MKPKILLLLGASRYYQKSIQNIKSYGYKVFVIDRNPNAPGFIYADNHAVIDIVDAEKAYQFAFVNKIDGVLAINDYGVRTAAYISQKMGLNSLSYISATIVTDKALMRNMWSIDDVPIPKYFVTDTFKEAKDRVKELTFPVIVKPADSRGGGSRGIKVVFDVKDLQD
jgi:biotin carboxylase